METQPNGILEKLIVTTEKLFEQFLSEKDELLGLYLIDNKKHTLFEIFAIELVEELFKQLMSK